MRFLVRTLLISAFFFLTTHVSRCSTDLKIDQMLGVSSGRWIETAIDGGLRSFAAGLVFATLWAIYDALPKPVTAALRRGLYWGTLWLASAGMVYLWLASAPQTSEFISSVQAGKMVLAAACFAFVAGVIHRLVFERGENDGQKSIS